jgi:hypothetical protein
MHSMANHNHESAIEGGGRIKLRDMEKLLETESGQDVLPALPEGRSMPDTTTAPVEEPRKGIENLEEKRGDENSKEAKKTPLPDFPSPFRRNLIFVAVSLSIFLVNSLSHALL